MFICLQVGGLGVGLMTTSCKNSLSRNLTYRKAGWIIRNDNHMTNGKNGNQKMEIKTADRRECRGICEAAIVLQEL